ncbi:MAG TPA: hypothetical protein VEN81_14115 [Planctomycetota bacterium]|nr:hypothetical protein [Planctomycetota bacterium]
MTLASAALMVLVLAAQDDPILKFEAPKEWTKEKPSSAMRKAQYRVPDKEKKGKDAELILSFFGRNSGGIEANLKRWSAQMGGVEAKPEVIEGKCKVTLVDLKGTYTPGFGGDVIEEARMIAAMVETDGGPWFFKLVGPAQTVGGWKEEMVKLLKAAQP